MKNTIILITKNEINYTLLLEIEIYLLNMSSRFLVFTLSKSDFDFMFPNDAETLCDSVKAFISSNKVFLFVSLTYSFHCGQQQKFVSTILQKSKVQIVQEGQTCLYIRILYTSNNKTFLYKNLCFLIFKLYNIVILRVYFSWALGLEIQIIQTI